MAAAQGNSGRLYWMVGMMAAVTLMLALFAPGMSQMAVPEEPDSQADSAPSSERPDEPADADAAGEEMGGYDAPTYTADTLPIYGEASDFGAPTMDLSSPDSTQSGPDTAAPATAPPRMASSGEGSGESSESSGPGGGAFSRTVIKRAFETDGPPSSNKLVTFKAS